MVLPELESLGSIPGALLAVALLLAAAFGLGGLVVGVVDRDSRSAFDASLLRVTVGLNLVGVLGIILGCVGWLAGMKSVWLLLAIGLLAVPDAWSARRMTAWRQIAARWKARPWGTVGGLTLAAVTLGPALCYPTGWDELVYHHELPRRWLADGWPAFYPDLAYSGFPSLGEILFWLAAPIESVITPRLVTWLCWTIGLLFLYRLLRRYLAKSSAAVLTLVFAISGAVLMISANCYVESIILMNVAALLFALRWPPLRFTRSRRCRLPVAPAILIGILAGGAAAVKLTAAAVLAIPCLWYAGYLVSLGIRMQNCPQKNRSPRSGSHVDRKQDSPPEHRSFASPRMTIDRPAPAPLAAGGLLVTSLIVALAVCLPFYLRPWLLAGNPFYPYFGHWFTADPARLETSQYHHALGSKFGLPGPLGFFAGPLLLAFHDDFFAQSNEILYDGSFGLQLIVLIVFATLGLAQVGRTHKRGQRLLPPLRSLPSLLPLGAVGGRRVVVLWPAVVLLVLYAFWFLTAQQARFAVPAVLALLPLAALGIRQLRGRQRTGALLLLLAAAFANSCHFRTAGHYAGSWLCVAGLVSRSDYVSVATADEAGKSIYLPLIRAMYDHTPGDARLMVLFEHRGFYLPRRYVLGTPFFQEQGFTPPERFRDAASLMDVLARERITHVVMTNAPAGPDQVPQWFDRLEPFLHGFSDCVQKGRLNAIWRSERYLLLAVSAAPPSDNAD